MNRSSAGEPPEDDADPLIDELIGRCRFPDHGELAVAVSGGADSVALLYLTCRTDAAVTAYHVDHGLRPGSAGEGAAVQSLATRWGADFVQLTVSVAGGPNLEARARRARYEALPDDVLTGHTAEDQAETVLLFLMRGVGPAGLAGIDPQRRPLLGVRRSETVALCALLGVKPFSDPSNDDPRFRRNRVRRELLPLMADIAERDVVPLLARTAALARDQRAIIDALAVDVDPTSARAVAALSPPLGREVLRRWFLAETGEEYGPDSAALSRMWGVASGDMASTDCGGRWRLSRSGGRLSIAHAMVGGDGIR